MESFPNASALPDGSLLKLGPQILRPIFFAWLVLPFTSNFRRKCDAFQRQPSKFDL
jgi:hypothetical protein